MTKKRTWEEFRETGLLLIINQTLHIFGWAIVIEIKDDGNTEVYPARTKFRGFDTKRVSESYIKVSKYMKKNATKLLKESEL